jgi:hypothetical protein
MPILLVGVPVLRWAETPLQQIVSKRKIKGFITGYFKSYGDYPSGSILGKFTKSSCHNQRIVVID